MAKTNHQNKKPLCILGGEDPKVLKLEVCPMLTSTLENLWYIFTLIFQKYILENYLKKIYFQLSPTNYKYISECVKPNWQIEYRLYQFISHCQLLFFPFQPSFLLLPSLFPCFLWVLECGGDKVKKFAFPVSFSLVLVTFAGIHCRNCWLNDLR